PDPARADPFGARAETTAPRRRCDDHRLRSGPHLRRDLSRTGRPYGLSRRRLVDDGHGAVGADAAGRPLGDGAVAARSGMTGLKERLKRQIALNGPISVAEYMAACLFDPQAGYYTTREPFGASGDFTTAPEISQMFGELLAVWAYSAWTEAGKPVPVTLLEIGPGRGTLMVDMLRTLDRLDPRFIALARIALLDASPRLVEVQKQKLSKGGRAKPSWYSSLSQLPDCPLIVVANELFDA